MKTKIFIDGSEGTTGLRIYERFEGRDDVELLKISSELRKDVNERKRLINESDITFLCLPDAAAQNGRASSGSWRYRYERRYLLRSASRCL